jgi:adenylate kinase
MDFDIIFVAGPQGSGKGTQGKRLAARLGFFFWGMGGILRDIMTQKSALALRIANMDEGELLPDEPIIEVLKARLPSLSGEKGIVFDGVPRRLGQADFLIPFLRAQGHKKMATLFLDLPREESIRRLLARAEHENRVDDTPEGIETRFRYYDEEMLPTLDFLRKETTFITIDATLSIEAIEQNIIKALGIL